MPVLGVGIGGECWGNWLFGCFRPVRHGKRKEVGDHGSWHIWSAGGAVVGDGGRIAANPKYLLEGTIDS